VLYNIIDLSFDIDEILFDGNIENKLTASSCTSIV
jgi:hypothetical protein